MKKNTKVHVLMKAIFYLLVAGSVVYMLLGLFLLPSETDAFKDQCRPLNAEWERVYPDASRESITLPARLAAERNERVTVEAALPQIVEGGSWLCLRSAYQDMKIYINGHLRQEYTTVHSRPFGRTSAGAYVFVKLYASDAGKALRVETITDSNNTGIMDTVYYGDKVAIWRELIRLYGTELAMAVIMFILAFISILFSIVYKLSHTRRGVLGYLGWGILLVAIWIICENRLRQLIFSNISVPENLIYFSKMLLPVPFMVYIDNIQEGRYQKTYLSLCLLSIANLFLCTALQFSGAVDFLDTMILMHAMIIAAGVAGFVTIVLDIRKKCIEDYKFVAVGLAVFVLTSVTEIGKIYVIHVDPNGCIVSAGLIFLLTMAVAKAGRDVLRLERERQSALTDNASKVSFLAKMSHEIRTPINTIIGMNEMIARENKDPALESYIENTQNAGKALISLVNDILDFSRIESGHLQLTENVYQLASLINDEVHMIQVRAEKKQLEVVVNVDDKLPSYLYGDEVRIKQVVSNLLTNAVKYTEEGSITFSVYGQYSDAGEFSLYFSVADTGVGIQEKDLSKIFDSFSRAEEKKYQNIEGTGLGLNIIKKLVEEMQGEIKVRSVYGRGSLFTVVIPQKIISAEPTGVKAEAFEEERSQLGSYRTAFVAPQAKILAVDDNEMNLAVVKGFLKRTQMQLDTALSGEKCLELCKEKRYDVILMDHMMPEPDGIETLRLLRQQLEGYNLHTPVVVLTANAVAGSREEYLAKGFAEYLSKPILPDKLEKVLRQFLPEAMIIPMEEPEETQEIANSVVLNTLVEELSQELREEAAPEVQEQPEAVQQATQETAVQPTAMQPTVMQSAEKQPEGQISHELGLFYCNGDEEMYGEMLEAYYKQGMQYAQTLPEYFEKKDWKNYAIITHAMKSSSLNIGAREFSNIAKEHEMAGKEEKADWITENWESFYESFKELLKEAEGLLQIQEPSSESEEEPEELTREEYLKECEMLMEYIRNYEMSACEEQIRRLQSISPEGLDPKKNREICEQLKSAIDEFDYAKAEELLQDWMNGVA